MTALRAAIQPPSRSPGDVFRGAPADRQRQPSKTSSLHLIKLKVEGQVWFENDAWTLVETDDPPLRDTLRPPCPEGNSS